MNTSVSDEKKQEEKQEEVKNQETKLNNVMKVSKITIHDTEVKEDNKNLSIVHKFLFF